MAPEEVEKLPENPDLQSFLDAGGSVEGWLEETHFADVAEWFQEADDEEAWRVFSHLGDEDRAELLGYANEAVQRALIDRLSDDELRRIVEQLPADEAVDILALAENDRVERVLRGVDFERARGLRELSAYQADTAGGLMTTDFLSVPQGTRVGDVIKNLKAASTGPVEVEDVGVFVVDDKGRPVGHISDRDLLTHSIHSEVQEAMEDEIVTVAAQEDQEEVAHRLVKYDLDAVPVVDASGVLIGVVSADDVLEVLEDEAEEDIRRIVGTSTEDQTRLSIFARVRGRLPLQGLTVAGGLATASILDFALGGSEAVSASSTDLLRYLPIIIGLAGNVGIQSSTILVRAFATGEVTEERERAVLGSEVLVGLAIGLVCGLVTAIVAPLLEDGETAQAFGMSVGIAICVAVTWASFLGCAVPIGCRRAGIDPAVVAGPFLITLSDVSGAAIFVAVARALGGALGG